MTDLRNETDCKTLYALGQYVFSATVGHNTLRILHVDDLIEFFTACTFSM